MTTRPIVTAVAVSTLAALLMPNVALSDVEKPGHSHFFSADGVPLADDCCLDPAMPTFILVHGFRASGLSADWLQQAGAIRRLVPPANVIVVDWRPARPVREPDETQAEESSLSLGKLLGMYQEYLDAVATGKLVAREIAAWIKQKGIIPHKTVLCGHSLGAQIAAFASNECARPEMCGEPVHTIIAADPAGPEFERSPPETRLDAGDAQHVIVVHTTELFGDEHSVGTADIYVQWPDEQPRNDVARHSRARELVTLAFQGEGLSVEDPTAFEPVSKSELNSLTSEILFSLPDECNLRVAAVSGDVQRAQAWTVTLRGGQANSTRENQP